jgi:hypothetical protein
VTSQPIGPAVFGFVRPVVVLPSSLLQDRSPGLTPILSHELIHIRRGDPFFAVIQVLAQCVWWFHPLIWWANREASRERERACDEEVLAKLKLDPAAYGQCLVDILRMKQRLRPVLAFPGVRAIEVTTRRLEHIMQPEPRFHLRTPRRCWATALVAAFVALPGAGLALDAVPQRDAPPEARSDPSRSTKAPDGADSPTFFVLPIRTELQHELIAGGKSANTLVVLNGFATVGKRGVDRMRALDILALRRALAAIKAGNPNASVVFVIGYLGDASQSKWQALQENQKLLTQECHDLAKESKLRVAYVYMTTANGATPDLWSKVVAAVRDIDLAKETATESAEGDSEVRAFPVRTRVTRFLTGSFTGSPTRGSDCVVYIDKPLRAADEPLVGPDLEGRIKRVVAKLELLNKDRIDFHLIPAGGSGDAYLRNRKALDDRFVGKPSQRLAELLGFKQSSVTF